MKQFILKSEPDKDGIVRLEDSDYHYLVRVRRLAAGECFPALLPNGEETLVKIVSIDKTALTGKAVLKESAQRHNGALPPIILFQALPKGDKMDLIVRQAAEGGITEIVPFVSEFSSTKLTAAKLTSTSLTAEKSKSAQKFLRWERIIKEARQQSGSKIATEIRQPFTMNELFDYWKNIKKTGLGLLFHHQQGLEHKSLHGYLNSNPQLIAFAVGPEGGFSGTEVSRFLENDFKAVTIGDTVLRTETAALYCAAGIRILLLEKDSWELK